jgi:hypothetical protein
MERNIIILTTTVNVFNVYTLYQKSKNDRIKTYNKSISKWLKTNFKIIVIDNSGYKFPNFKENERFIKLDYVYDELEISYEYNFIRKSKNKGSHEMLSILYAQKNIPSSWKYNKIFKLTGRYFIPYFYDYIKNIDIYSKFYIQDNEDRCELFGCHKDYFNHLFILPIESEDYMSLENRKKKIIKELSNKYKIYNFPKIPVDGVIKGSSNRFIRSL